MNTLDAGPFVALAVRFDPHFDRLIRAHFHADPTVVLAASSAIGITGWNDKNPALGEVVRQPLPGFATQVLAVFGDVHQVDKADDAFEFAAVHGTKQEDNRGLRAVLAR